VEWADALDGEVVSADSMQVYRQMDIGPPSPPGDTPEGPPPSGRRGGSDERYSAARFRKRRIGRSRESGAVGEMCSLSPERGCISAPSREVIPCARRGSGVLRERLQRDADALGSETLHERLAQVDPRAARRIHPRDAFRHRAGDRGVPDNRNSISRHQENHGFARERYRALYLGLHVERSVLSRRIDRPRGRDDHRGLLEEVRGLIAQGYGPDLPSMGSLGGVGTVTWGST